MKRALLAFGAVLLIAMVFAAPAAAGNAAQTFSYVVQPGDTLSSIARQNCTTWQEIYYRNQAVIGPYPNVLRPGTVLVVTNHCGGGATPTPSPGGCNLGPIQHAMGPVSGNIYTVVPGDTLFSIGRRFCTTSQQLAATNGIPNPWRIYVGQRLVIPGLGPTPSPTVSPSPGARYLTITAPTSGAVLPPTFTVSGTGAGLFEGNVVVTAYTNSGQFLAQRSTTLQGTNVGTGGAGTWSTQLTVNVAAGTPGYIQATSPQSNVAPAQVSVTYGQPAAVTLRINTPAAGTSLPATFAVSGTAIGLPLGTLVTVQARNASNQILTQQSATLLGGSEPGTGGSWSTTLTVNAAPGTPGSIAAFVAGTSASASVQVTFNGGSSTASISISNPTGGAVLPPTFVVNGSGSGLPGGVVQVRAQNSQGQILAQQQVALVGSNGQGTWSVTFTVNTTPGTPGFIVATAPGTSAMASVPVTFGGSTPPVYHTYAPGQCRIQGRPGAPFYASPNGQQSGQFVVGNVWYDVPMGARTGNQYWYQFNLDPGTGNPPQWAPDSSVATMLSTCVW